MKNTLILLSVCSLLLALPATARPISKTKFNGQQLTFFKKIAVKHQIRQAFRKHRLTRYSRFTRNGFSPPNPTMGKDIIPGMSKILFTVRQSALDYRLWSRAKYVERKSFLGEKSRKHTGMDSCNTVVLYDEGKNKLAEIEYGQKKLSDHTSTPVIRVQRNAFDKVIAVRGRYQAQISKENGQTAIVASVKRGTGPEYMRQEKERVAYPSKLKRNFGRLFSKQYKAGSRPIKGYLYVSHNLIHDYDHRDNAWDRHRPVKKK